MEHDLSHLHPSVRTHALEPENARLARAHVERWIHYRLAGLALDWLQWLLDYPECARMPCLLLYGDSGMGKTKIIEKFLRDHQPVFDFKEGVEHRPVVSMQMPPTPDPRFFYAQLLKAIHAPFSNSDTHTGLATLSVRLLTHLRPRLLIVDEIHHLLAGTPRQQRHALNTLKFLANELRVAVVAVGTHDALHAMQSDAQIASRFKPFELPRWTETEEFRALLGAFEQLLPLQKPSGLTDQQMVRRILKQSDGITGRVVSLLCTATEHAILDGSERIDTEKLALAENPPPRHAQTGFETAAI